MRHPVLFQLWWWFFTPQGAGSVWNECSALAPSYPGAALGGLEEEIAVQRWFDVASIQWREDFQNERFELWNEFDIGRSKELHDELMAYDYKSVGCERGKLWDLRWSLGYQAGEWNAWDWDEKIGKKGIVSAMQGQSDPALWYVPVIYNIFDPAFSNEVEVPKIVSAVSSYFASNPNTIVFIKVSLKSLHQVGSTGTPWCEPGTTQLAQMYKLREVSDMEGAIRTCLKLLKQQIDLNRKAAREDEDKRDFTQKPSLAHAWPGLLIEPGFEHMVEIQGVVIWGKLFAIGSARPDACLLYTNDFQQLRGFPGDARATRSGGTIWDEVVQKSAIINRTSLERAQTIAESLGKHADYLRVDFFINTMTNETVVNDVETYWDVCGSDDIFDQAMIKLMTQLWVEGWQQYERRNQLIRVARPFSNFQMALQSSVYPELGSSWLSGWSLVIAWLLSTIAAFAAGFALRVVQSPQGRARSESVELRRQLRAHTHG